MGMGVQSADALPLDSAQIGLSPSVLELPATPGPCFPSRGLFANGLVVQHPAAALLRAGSEGGGSSGTGERHTFRHGVVRVLC